ncbi:flagellar hook-length control protein FliK [Pseudoalteromonas lipolytica]|uniref:Flagellar hook-length control protein FliK n=1 Tax=Pseudoalteromonas lipolytica TaxID=570156 RepID=A0ABY1GDI0_9GAMM|nr:flagellar hook-length control protein FliK [Pseudoalteromonas lipolytica]MBE0351586.1 flagellar hook-length control protein FliK [Pseudoalteromonas lipolytica LMEB 39]SFT48828.1 flagellar hook-length control protein FliK [Pseudoalteromonas lipolytica]
MAISDINLQVKTEHDTGFLSKESEANDHASGLSFLTELSEASEAVHSKTVANKQSDNSNVMQSEAEQAGGVVANNTQSKQVSDKPTRDDEATDVALIEGEDNPLLSQINASHAMSTRVNVLADKHEFSGIVVDKKPTPIDDITPVIPSPLSASLADDDALSDSENSVANLLTKSKVATAIDNQLKPIGELPPKDSVTPIIDSPSVLDDTENAATVNTAKQSQVITANTAEQNAAMKQAAQATELLSSVSNDTKAASLGSVVTPSGEVQESPIVDAKLAPTNNAAENAKNIASKPAIDTDNTVTKMAAINSDDSVMSEKAANESVTNQSIVSLLAKVQSGDGQAVSQFAKELTLTSTQQVKLEQQINQLKAAGELSSNDVDKIKALLSEVMNVHSEKTQTPQPALVADAAKAALSNATESKVSDSKVPDSKVPAAIEKQIATLTKDEQQALLNKVNAQLQSLTPGTQQNEKLVAVQTLLSDAVTPVKADAVTPTLTATTEPDSKSPKAERSEQLSVLKNASAVNTDTETTSKLDTLLDTERPKEVSTARVVQLFNQLTAPLNPSQTGAYDAAYQQYEQALDVHSFQTQAQQQPQSKTVSLDSGVMQAINIIKSDAAKMLQERVSALLNINNKEAEIRLDPPEMGSMQIRIRSDAEQAQINFVVQNQQAKEALEQSMPRLREMLAQQGIELGESSIQQGNPEQQGSQSEQGQLAGHHNDEEVQQDVTTQSVETSRQQSSSSIDYYA